MERHVPGGVVEGEVVLGQGGLARVEGGLVAQGVRSVAHRSGHVHNRAANIRSCKTFYGDNYQTNIGSVNVKTSASLISVVHDM